MSTKYATGELDDVGLESWARHIVPVEKGHWKEVGWADGGNPRERCQLESAHQKLIAIDDNCAEIYTDNADGMILIVDPRHDAALAKAEELSMKMELQETVNEGNWKEVLNQYMRSEWKELSIEKRIDILQEGGVHLLQAFQEDAPDIALEVLERYYAVY